MATSEVLVAICDDCGERITDVLDWVVIESVELCAACYANTTRRTGVEMTEPGTAAVPSRLTSAPPRR